MVTVPMLSSSMSVLLRDPISESLSPERKAVLEKLFSGIGTLTTLPTAAHRILQLTEDESADPNKLREAIQSDPVLVARILRRLNSAYFSLSHRVSDIRTAVSLLGIQEIRNLALTVYVSRMFERKGDHGTYRRKDLWNHSVAVAAAARLVARVCGHGVSEDVYIAGLLHDLGLILLDQGMRKHFCRVVDELTPATPAYLVEQRNLTFDHATLGGFVAQKWNFPQQISDAIAYRGCIAARTSNWSLSSRLPIICVAELGLLRWVSTTFRRRRTKFTQGWDSIKLPWQSSGISWKRRWKRRKASRTDNASRRSPVVIGGYSANFPAGRRFLPGFF